MSLTLKLEGFDGILKQIEKAGGNIETSARQCLSDSAQIMHNELKKQMQISGVDGGLISRMPAPEVEKDGNRFTARVGYKKGAYDPNNPSDGYEVVFINYGTPKRSKHGKIVARGFIQNAKKQAGKRIKKAQGETLDKILGGLKG